MKTKFKFNEKYNEYVATINNIKVYVKELDEKIVNYAEDLVKKYANNLDKIVGFMLNSNVFNNESGIYKNVSKEKLLKSLNDPCFRLTSNKHCEIIYYNHTLDKENIISFEVGGVYEKLAYLSING